MKYPYRLTFLLIAAFCIGCTNDLCSNQVIIEKVNNSKTQKLIHFDRDCGATTGNSNQISIISIDGNLDNNKGNIFIAGSGSGSNLEVDREVIAEWLNDTAISIKYDTTLTVFKKIDKLGKIKIVYESL